MTVLCLTETAPCGPGEEDRGPWLAAASARALAFARLLGPVTAVTFGPAGPALAADVARFGAAELCVVTADGLCGYAPQAWGRALAGLAAHDSATAVVAAGTDHGSEVLAHLAAITGQPLAAQCVSATPAPDGGYAVVRHRWGGSLLEDATLDGSPALFTVAADTVLAEAAPPAGPATPREYRATLLDGDLTVLARPGGEPAAGPSLAAARVVVGGGRGVGGPDGFAPLEELAGLLGGVLGVSRVVTTEGWRPHQQQIGQTGARIAPDLYLACGISGAVPHMAGCLAARHIVAVNTDPDAPVMTRADYAVVGDLHEVIPALVAAIHQRRAADPASSRRRARVLPATIRQE